MITRKHFITLLAGVLSLGSLSAAPAPAPTAAKKTYAPDRLQLYKTVDGVQLNLHVFEPEGLKKSDKRPAIVFFFVGGWTGGNAKQFFQQARYFSDRGFVCFSADYRIKSKHKTTPFECVKDGKSAIRYVRAHAAELGVDPNRIVASGGSAGGHVAGCTGVIKANEEKGEDLKVSSLPNLMVLYNPVLDTTKKGYGAKRFKPEQQTDLSLTHQVKKGIVPTLVFHGTADKTVPFENAERFGKLMKKAGNECVVIPYEGKGHGFFNGPFFRPKSKGETYDQVMKQTEDFLKKHGFSAK